MSTDRNRAHLIERAAARLAIAEEMTAPPLLAAGRSAGAATEMAAMPSPASGQSQAISAADELCAPPISSDALAGAGLIDWGQRHNRTADEFRIVQSQLLRESFGATGRAASGRDNLILVSSALPGEGKSFVSLNLAAGIARQGDRRVLIVDADMKPGSLGYLLGVSGVPGLLDLARSGGADIEEAVVRTAVEHLDVLPLGSDIGIGDSNELFASARMADLIHNLGRRYADRLIIFDAPPCLSSSLPHLLAPLVGQVVVVVAAGSTQQADVEAALDLVQNCPRVVLLLNKVPLWNAHSFGSYSYPIPPV